MIRTAGRTKKGKAVPLALSDEGYSINYDKKILLPSYMSSTDVTFPVEVTEFNIMNDSDSDLKFYISGKDENIPETPNTWEMGSIQSSSGNLIGEEWHPNRVRSAEFTPMYGDFLTVTWTDAGRRLLIIQYDEDENFISNQAYHSLGVWMQSGDSFMKHPDAAFYKAIWNSWTVEEAEQSELTFTTTPIIVKPGEGFTGNFNPFNRVHIDSSGTYRCFGRV